jgi:hypothetical protein
VTLIVKVKAHRGDPLNEEEENRAEMGRLKDHDEITWDDSTDRTVYKWTEMSNTVEGASKPKTSYQLAQSAIRSDGKQEKGKLSNDKKWCEDHITRTQELPSISRRPMDTPQTRSLET